MATKEAIRLCSYIILDDFGPVIQAVAYLLLTRGRLTSAQIMQYKPFKREQGHPPKYTKRDVMRSLVVLIQHCLCTRSEIAEGQQVKDYYEIDPTAVLLRLRIPKIIAFAGYKLGETEQQVLTYIFEHGLSKYSTIVSELKLSDKVEQKLDRLIEHNYLQARDNKSTISSQDRKIRLEAERLNNENFLTLKKRTEIILKVKEDIKAQEAAYDEMIREGTKRKMKGSEKLNLSNSKKQRLEAYLSVNMEKFSQCFRDDVIIVQAEESFGTTFGEVMRAVLESAEEVQSSSNTFSAEMSKNITLSSVMAKLDQQRISLQGSYYAKKSSNKDKSQRRLLLTHMLETMSNKPTVFIKTDAQNHETYFVPYRDIIARIRQETFESFLSEKYGPIATRIFRVIRDKEKVDDKMLSNIALIPQRDAREYVARLAIAGFLDLQEVPKTADRMTSRAILLWCINEQKCFKIILNMLYKDIANLRQRRIEEIARHHDLLRKMERIDVQENIDLLSHQDREEYEKLEEALCALDTAEERLEQLVFLIRDCAGC